MDEVLSSGNCAFILAKYIGLPTLRNNSLIFVTAFVDVSDIKKPLPIIEGASMTGYLL